MRTFWLKTQNSWDFSS